MENQHAQFTNDLLNITAIMLKDPDGPSVLGVWHCMETIAVARPDSCVCLIPGVPMTVPEIASYFHFPVTLVEKTVSWLQKLGRLTLSGGLLQFIGCCKNAAEGLTPKEEAKKTRIREQTRLRVAKFREMKKEKVSVTPPETNVVMQNVTAEVTPAVTRVVTHDVTEVVTQNGITDTNIINNNKKYALYADKLISYKPVKRVLDAWNKLPLRKFTGLIPLLQKKLQHLLQRYGEETVVKTVERIGSSAFLLGKKAGSTWTVTLGWLLEPGNFAKVLAGNYFDRPNSSAAADWQPGERCPFYLPGEGTEAFTPEEERQALRNLFIPTTPAQKKAARLLGLADRGCAA